MISSMANCANSALLFMSSLRLFYKGSVPYDTCTPYLACSEESTEGFCDKIDTSCSAVNTCKTCDTFGGMVSRYNEYCIEKVVFYVLLKYTLSFTHAHLSLHSYSYSS